MKNKFITLLFIGMLGYSIPASAATLNVPADYPKIQDAIDASVDGDIVLVDDGTYVENINFNGRGITLISKNGANNTVIDGDQNGSVVTFVSYEGRDSILDGFTIANGSGYDDGSKTHGGGIFIKRSSPLIKNSVITNNSSIIGGGIYSDFYSTSTISNCEIFNNTADLGAGIFMSSGQAEIINCRVRDNLKGEGIFCGRYFSGNIENCEITGNAKGGIICNPASPSIKNCIIKNNRNCYGGGISCYEQSSPDISNCIIEDNSACYGGGIYCYKYSWPFISDTIIRNNSADQEGGGVWSDTLTPDLLANCVISGNSAENGGGFFLYGGGERFEEMGNAFTINDCVIIDNSATNGGGVYIDNDSRLTMENSIINSNRASSYGGGIYVSENASISVYKSKLNFNSAIVGGGGAYGAINSRLSVRNSFVDFNCAELGGGFYFDPCDTTYSRSLITCVITNNRASQKGGAVFIAPGTTHGLTVQLCTISDNAAPDTGGIYYDSDSSNSGVQNSIVWGNEGGDIYSKNLASFTFYFSNIGGGTWPGAINVDPLFVAPGDYHLRFKSPCIDAAMAAGFPYYDIDGDLRSSQKRDGDIDHPRFDIGADEYAFLPTVMMTLNKPYFPGNTQLTKYKIGEKIETYFEIIAGKVPKTVDLYIKMTLPNGRARYYPSWTAKVAPFRSSWAVVDDGPELFYEKVLGDKFLTGEYKIEIYMTRAGGKKVLGRPSFVKFLVVK